MIHCPARITTTHSAHGVTAKTLVVCVHS